MEQNKLLTLGGLIKDMEDKENLDVYINTPYPEAVDNVKLIAVCTLPDGSETTRIIGDTKSFVACIKLDDHSVEGMVFSDPAHIANSTMSLIDSFATATKEANTDSITKITLITEFVKFIGKTLEGAVVDVMGSIYSKGQQEHNEDVSEGSRKDNVRPLQRS